MHCSSGTQNWKALLLLHCHYIFMTLAHIGVWDSVNNLKAESLAQKYLMSIIFGMAELSTRFFPLCVYGNSLFLCLLTMLLLPDGGTGAGLTHRGLSGPGWCSQPCCFPYGFLGGPWLYSRLSLLSVGAYINVWMLQPPWRLWASRTCHGFHSWVKNGRFSAHWFLWVHCVWWTCETPLAIPSTLILVMTGCTGTFPRSAGRFSRMTGWCTIKKPLVINARGHHSGRGPCSRCLVQPITDKSWLLTATLWVVWAHLRDEQSEGEGAEGPAPSRAASKWQGHTCVALTVSLPRWQGVWAYCTVRGHPSYASATSISFDKAAGLRGPWGQAAQTRCASGPIGGSCMLPPRSVCTLQPVEHGSWILGDGDRLQSNVCCVPVLTSAWLLKEPWPSNCKCNSF